MKGKFFACVMLMALLVSPVFAQENWTAVVGGNGRVKDSLCMDNYTLYLELADADSDGQRTINVILANKYKDKALWVFDKAYDEKTLKKQLAVAYDESVEKNNRSIDACDGMQGPKSVLPNEVDTIMTIMTGDESLSLRLPVYTAAIEEKSFLKKGRHLLNGKELVEANVEIRTDEDLAKLQDDMKQMLEEFRQENFCSNKYHKGTPLKTLQKKYRDQISKLKLTAKNVIKKRKMTAKDKAYQKYDEIIKTLDGIDIEGQTFASCPEDIRPVPGAHTCKYCSLTYAEIYKKLQTYQTNLKKKKVKYAKIKADVDALYKCAQSNKIRSAEEYISELPEIYKKITKK